MSPTPWFYVDDQFEGHAKVGEIPRKIRTEAIGLWTLAGSWCARMLTDGFVPASKVEDFCGTKRAVDALIAARLWAPHEVDGKRGFVFVDWAQWQTTKEAVLADRAANAKRQERHRNKRKGISAGQEELDLDSDDVSNGVTDGVSNGGVTPSVTRPPSTPSTPSTQTEQTSSVPAAPAADATAPAAAEQAAFDVEVEVPLPPRTSQTLVKEWIDRGCEGKRPPGRVVGHVSRELSVLLNRDQIPYEDVRRGLAVWHDRRLSPSLLASVVHEVRVEDTPAMSPNGGAPTRRPANGVARPSHTDARVAAGLSLVAEMAREEAARAGAGPREIER